MKAVAIIPARGGSKRLPGKNLRGFAGRPMIAWPIGVALDSGLFDRVIVSTDDARVAEEATAAGAECPFVRPAELSDDHTPLAPVVTHALELLCERPRYACLILATAPFLRVGDLRRGYSELTAAGCGSVFSVTTFPFPIQRALSLTSAGCLEMMWPEHELTRSQDLPETYHDAGQFYWLDVDRFLADRRLYCDDSRPVVLPRHRVQDIDTKEDWIVAERLFLAADARQRG